MVNSGMGMHLVQCLGCILNGNSGEVVGSVY